MISIPCEHFRFLELVPTEDSLVRLADGAGQPVVSTSQLLAPQIADGFHRSGDAWDYGGALPVEGWRLQVRYRQSVPGGQSGQPFRVLFLIMLPVAIFCLLVTLWFSQYLTNPILRCKRAILAIRDNELGIQVENGYTDEIGELIDGLNDMSLAIANLVDQNRIMYLLKRDAEFDVLQQKINPHFLYNTLEIINGLILDGEHKHAVRVCEMLGQMFRYNLDDHKWVTVREECDYVRRYLTVLGYSSTAGLEMEFEVDPCLEKRRVLKFIMQPLVENSVRHGFHKSKTGCLTVQVDRVDSHLHIAVMDNGRGIEEAALERLRESIYSKPPAPGNAHIGLSNVYQRLQMEYGDEARFTISSVPGRGTKTEIWIREEDLDAL